MEEHLLPRELRQYSNRKVFIALGAIILVALLTTSVTLVAISQLMSVRQSSIAGSNGRGQLQALITNLRTAESHQRGYLLTGDASFLLRHSQTVEQVKAIQNNLVRQSNQAAYPSDIKQLVPLIKAKLDTMNNGITLYQAGSTTEAITASLLEGRAEMDSLIKQTDTIVAKQTAVLNRDRANIEALANTARNISLLTLILTLVLAATAYYLYLKAIKAERDLDRAKDGFVSLASHQLRTPATGIKSILAMLAAKDLGPLTDRQNYFIRQALESNTRELRIIEELLNVAKADAGRLVLHESRFELGELIAGIVTEQRHVIEAKKQTLEVKSTTAPINITADKDKLFMAIGNLLDNARKYTPEGGRISIIVRHRRDTAIVEVIDTGIGIDEAEQARIFDRFKRASNLIKGNIEGTGLGLYLARRIAELHNGTIEVSSKRGHGAHFTLSLPTRRT